MRRRAAALLIPLFLVAACGNSASDPDSPSASASAGVTGELPTVTGGFGEEPTVELPDSDPGTALQVEVLEKGDGPVVAAGEVVVADYLGQRWAGTPSETASDTASETAGADPSEAPSDAATSGGDGVFDSTFESGSPLISPLSPDNLLAGMVSGLEGQTVGSRVLVVIPPALGFGDAGSTDLGIGADDTIVFVFDVLDGFSADAAADGTPVEQSADPGLPTVTEADTGPTITVPSATTPPTELVVQTVLEGAGAEVLTGQSIVVQYRGVLWKDGSEFDSSWSRRAPTNFPIGVGGVIPGWDKGLVGQTVGSQVLLVVPPAEGYGEAGNAPTIAGDDTLVFVVDILGAYGAA